MAEYEALELLPQVITIEKRTAATSNGYPIPEYGPAKQYPGLAEFNPRYGLRMIRTVEGNELVPGGIVYLATDWIYTNGVLSQQAVADTVSPGDRLTLPDGTQPPIFMVEPEYDETGTINHTVLYTG